MRQTLPLPFGSGIDRTTGRFNVRPTAHSELQNVWLEEARVRLRHGLQATGFPNVPAGTDVCAMCMLEATLDVIFVLYERSTRALTVARLNPLATPAMQTVGTWGTVSASATLPPVISWAESYGKLFLAHAEPVLAYRLATKVYTPNATDATVGAIATLQADLNGDAAAADVYFRGVYAWNDSMCGYGYGEETSSTTQNRPEIIRISNPADPTTFKPEAYFIAGKRSTPITGLGALPNVGLVVAKTTATYLITGTDAETYGIQLIDPHFGNLSDRTVLSARDMVWLWSLQGPRLTTGGATVDMAMALALDTPQPAALPAPGDQVHAFAIYDIIADAVEFVWPDRATADGPTLSYVASLREPGNIRWSYHVRDGCIACATTVLLGKEDPPTITAYADFTATADGGIATNPAYRKATLTWDNLGSYLGTETYEVWVKPSGGSWTLHTTVAHSNASTQTATITNLLALQAYELAVRATRGGAYVTGYQQDSPDDWSAGTAALSKATVTTSCGTPGAPSLLSWARASSSTAAATLSFTLADTTVPYVLQTSSNGVSWSDYAAFTTRPPTYTHDNSEAGTTRYFRILPKRGSVSGTAGASAAIYLGPTNGVTLSIAGRGPSDEFVVYWTATGLSSYPTVQLQSSSNGVSYADVPGWSWGGNAARRLLLGDATYWQAAVGADTYLRWRVQVTSYGVTDSSSWTVAQVKRSATAAPSAPSVSATPPAGTGTGYDTTFRLYKFTPSGVSAGANLRLVVIQTGGLYGDTIPAGYPLAGGASTYNGTVVNIGLDPWDSGRSLAFNVLIHDTTTGRWGTATAITPTDLAP